MITEEAVLSPAEQLAILTVNALNVLQNKYCCPDCCGQCRVLTSLLVSGRLDEVVNDAPRFAWKHPVWQVMGAQGLRVSRRWLYSRWNPDLNMFPCIHLSVDVEEEEEDSAARKVGPRISVGKACATHRRARKRCTCRSEPAVI